jgi:hypothetical protein
MFYKVLMIINCIRKLCTVSLIIRQGILFLQLTSCLLKQQSIISCYAGIDIESFDTKAICYSGKKDTPLLQLFPV